MVIYTIFSKIPLVQRHSFTVKVDNYCRWRVFGPLNHQVDHQLLVVIMTVLLNWGLWMKRTSFTAGLSLSVARWDWQVTKALAVMKSLQCGWKAEEPTGWGNSPYRSVFQNSSTNLLLFTSGGAKGDERGKSLQIIEIPHCLNLTHRSQFGACSIVKMH